MIVNNYFRLFYHYIRDYTDFLELLSTLPTFRQARIFALKIHFFQKSSLSLKLEIRKTVHSCYIQSCKDSIFLNTLDILRNIAH